MKKNVPKLLPTHMPIAAIYYGHTTFSSGFPVLANKTSCLPTVVFVSAYAAKCQDTFSTFLFLLFPITHPLVLLSSESIDHTQRFRFETIYEGLAVACDMPLFDIISNTKIQVLTPSTARCICSNTARRCRRKLLSLPHLVFHPHF